MTIEAVKEFLVWCLVLNYSLLIVWFLLFWCWHDGYYRLHSRWFPISLDQFNLVHYALMGIYKILIFIFNLMPLLAICLIQS